MPRALSIAAAGATAAAWAAGIVAAAPTRVPPQTTQIAATRLLDSAAGRPRRGKARVEQ